MRYVDYACDYSTGTWVMNNECAHNLYLTIISLTHTHTHTSWELVKIVHFTREKRCVIYNCFSFETPLNFCDNPLHSRLKPLVDFYLISRIWFRIYQKSLLKTSLDQYLSISFVQHGQFINCFTFCNVFNHCFQMFYYKTHCCWAFLVSYMY